MNNNFNNLYHKEPNIISRLSNRLHKIILELIDSKTKLVRKRQLISIMLKMSRDAVLELLDYLESIGLVVREKDVNPGKRHQYSNLYQISLLNVRKQIRMTYFIVLVFLLLHHKIIRHSWGYSWYRVTVTTIEGEGGIGNPKHVLDPVFFNPNDNSIEEFINKFAWAIKNRAKRDAAYAYPKDAENNIFIAAISILKVQAYPRIKKLPFY